MSNPHAGGFLSELDKSTTEEYGNLGKVLESWWVQSKVNGLAIATRQRKQFIGYPTQKPIALLERIIKASSNKGEIVFDPFCGCDTAIEAGNKLDLGRRHILHIWLTVSSANCFACSSTISTAPSCSSGGYL